ncbi:MAG: ATP-binding protein [Phycisphaerales bacterium]|nr:ATP-binding protein [Phycisphaerales bacterium]
MAKKRSITISLAAKCQLLFGLAVLVIIAGALAVPWQRMEELAGQPNIKVARQAADMHFREIHFGATTKPEARSQKPEEGNSNPVQSSNDEMSHRQTQTAPPRTDREWSSVTLTEAKYTRPRIYKAPSATEGFPPETEAGQDAIANEALKEFRKRQQETEPDFGKMFTLTDKNGEKTRVYRYAAAIRLDPSCIKCHTEYTAWLVPRPAATKPSIPEGRGSEKVASSKAKGKGGAVEASTTAPASWPVVGVVRVDVPYQTDENQLLLNRIVIVVSGMLGGTLAIVVFYLITSRLILQPVRVLKNTAEKVAQGDLKIRSAISTGDEFQHLSETFNTMLATLQASQDQLEATNRSLDTRVGELAQSNVDLFEANRMKSEFLTNVTHELRTPLNAIIGFADLLSATTKDPKQQRYAENIKTSATQLLQLINDLLDLAKIEAGKLVLREERVHVADVCEAMVNFMRPLAQKKNIELQMSVAPDMPLITTDPGRFQQILYNFLSNAIKFTPAEGTIGIDARNVLSKTEGQEQVDVVGAVRISVTDSGPGISAEDQKLIFEKFRQLDGSVTRQHSGTGLGLAISAELANMLGARIEVRSTLGKGATFSVEMPLVNPLRTVEVSPLAGNPKSIV